MVKAIIFDCFGVLIGDGMAAVMQQFVADKPIERQCMQQAMEDVNSGRMSPDESSAIIAECVGLTLEELRAQVRAGEPKNAELFAWIKTLRPRFKTALLTNISRPSLEKRFTQTELAEYFDVQIVSGEQGFTKPDARIYQAALDALGMAPEEAVFIDDRQNYLHGAQKLGIKTILFKDNEQFFAEITQYIE